MIYIDANSRLVTWRLIAEAGGYQLYRGVAQSGDVVLRWGCNHSQHTYPSGTRVLNKKIILSKIDQANLFLENGVLIPPVYWTRLSWERAGRPQVVIKPNIGQMGTGMRLSNSPDWSRDKLNQHYIAKEREFRAMMVGNHLAFFMEKHPPSNGDFRWNEHRGAVWSSVPEERSLRRDIKIIAHMALRAIDYDFGAVDIIKCNGTLYVLEVNSRPEFGAMNAERFVRAVNSYLQEG